MAKTLFILNDSPYGTERNYNALRLAGSLAKREGEQVKVFLIADGELSDATHRSSLDQLTDWTQWADRVVVF
jgi:sulfur relay (sulfurtransferase) complex TusBCD TusD component (DsrE family)